jgi:hypothetical protein
MNKTIARFALAPSTLCLLGLLVVGTLCNAKDVSIQQIADPHFDATVSHPTYMEKHPQVLFDEAHFNFHTSEGRYKPFVDLITNDGYQVTANKVKFEEKALEGYDVLVIANAMGAESLFSPEAGTPAFTEKECDVIRDWVWKGGSLLLIADHPPFGAAAANLSQRFGIEMSQAWTRDTSNSDGERSTGFLHFTRDKRLLGNHSITRGRDATERIDHVMTFSGQSLKGPDESLAFLILAETAVDLPHLESREGISAAGHAQGIAMYFGQGRVVVLGEAAMLSAQLFGEEQTQMGMNRTGYENRQLALNIMHWLSGLLP